MALADLGCTAAEVLVVGDDPENDAGGARAVGAPCVLVRTGKFGARARRGGPAAATVIDSIADLPVLLEARSARGLSGVVRAAPSIFDAANPG